MTAQNLPNSAIPRSRDLPAEMEIKQ